MVAGAVALLASAVLIVLALRTGDQRRRRQLMLTASAGCFVGATLMLGAAFTA